MRCFEPFRTVHSRDKAPGPDALWKPSMQDEEAELEWEFQHEHGGSQKFSGYSEQKRMIVKETWIDNPTLGKDVGRKAEFEHFVANMPSCLQPNFVKEF